MKIRVFILFVFILTILLNPLHVFAIDTSKSSIVMDLDSGRVLYSKNSNEKKLIASTTKILTAIVAIENANLDEIVKIGEEILTMYGTNIYIEVGESISIRDLLYGLLLRSGNDAAIALAVAVSGSEEAFVEEMNKKAKKIGMKNSIFANPHGLDENSQNYSTAYDMAILSKYAYHNKTYREIASTKKHTVSTGEKTYLWYNRNKLLSSYQYCTGGKNGYTPSAGRTLVTTATKENLNLTIVTLNDPNEYETHKSLYEDMFDKYKNYAIIDKDNFAINSSFYKGDPYLKKSFYYPLMLDEIDKIKTIIDISETKTNKIGSIKVYLDSEKIGEVSVYDKQSKKKEENFFLKFINQLLDNLKKFILG